MMESGLMMPRSSVLPNSSRWLSNAPLNSDDPMALPIVRPFSALNSKSASYGPRFMAWPPPLNSKVHVPLEMPASNLNWRVSPGPMEVMPSVGSNRAPLSETMTACKPPTGMADSLTTSTMTITMSSSSSSISMLTDMR
jgi:hypothetical protein